MLKLSEKLGMRIQELRKLRGLTQSELAELIDAEIVTISRIENGSRFPKKENIENIANALHAEVKDLFDYEHHQTKAELADSIQKLLEKSSLEDLKYVYRLLRFYFEAK